MAARLLNATQKERLALEILKSQGLTDQEARYALSAKRQNLDLNNPRVLTVYGPGDQPPTSAISEYMQRPFGASFAPSAPSESTTSGPVSVTIPGPTVTRASVTNYAARPAATAQGPSQAELRSILSRAAEIEQVSPGQGVAFLRLNGLNEDEISRVEPYLAAIRGKDLAREQGRETKASQPAVEQAVRLTRSALEEANKLGDQARIHEAANRLRMLTDPDPSKRFKVAQLVLRPDVPPPAPESLLRRGTTPPPEPPPSQPVAPSAPVAPPDSPSVAQRIRSAKARGVSQQTLIDFAQQSYGDLTQKNQALQVIAQIYAEP